MKKVIFTLIALLSGGSVLAANQTINWTNPSQFEDNTTIPTALLGTGATVSVDYGSCGANNVVVVKEGTATGAASAKTIVITPPGAGVWCYQAKVTLTDGRVSAFSNGVTSTVVAPNPKPPSLVVGPITAYTVVKQVDRFVMLPVGTVPAGTPCSPDQSVNGYNVVPRSAVVFSGSVKPDVVVAQCS